MSDSAQVQHEPGGRLLGGRYRLTRPLGRGGMAVVWQATDEALGRQVAIKMVDLTGPDHDDAAERFRREAWATASLNHPNIVTVFDTGTSGDTAYLVMELLPGYTLADRLKAQGRLEADEVRWVGRQVASALAAAHSAGLIHRDVKPSNIGYAADGRVKVLDFGITHIVDEALGGRDRLTSTDMVIGTAEYLSPEQANGERIDARSDLYSLGCVLYGLLVGGPPFRADTPMAVLFKHIREDPPPLSQVRPELPTGLVQLVEQLLAKPRDGRPQSANEVVHRLDHLDLSPPARLASAPSSGPGPRSGSSRARWVAWGLAVAVLLGVGGYLLVGRLLEHRPGTTARPATGPLTSATVGSPSPTSAATAPSSPPQTASVPNPPSAVALYDKARASAATATSVRFEGFYTEKGKRSTFAYEGRLDGSNQRFTISQPTGGTAEVIVVGKRAYIKGDKAFWTANGGAAAYGMVKDKYVSTSTKDLGAQFPTGRSVLTEMFKAAGLNSLNTIRASVTTTTVDGVAAYRVADPPAVAGAGEFVVQAGGKGYLLRFAATGAQAAELRFSQWDAVPALTAPPAGRVVTF